MRSYLEYTTEFDVTESGVAFSGFFLTTLTIFFTTTFFLASELAFGTGSDDDDEVFSEVDLSLFIEICAGTLAGGSPNHASSVTDLRRAGKNKKKYIYIYLNDMYFWKH